MSGCTRVPTEYGRLVKGVLPSTAVLLAVAAQPAAAAFPGTNGPIAMERRVGRLEHRDGQRRRHRRPRRRHRRRAPRPATPRGRPTGAGLRSRAPGTATRRSTSTTRTAAPRPASPSIAARRPRSRVVARRDAPRLRQRLRDGNQELYVVSAAGGSPTRPHVRPRGSTASPRGRRPARSRSPATARANSTSTRWPRTAAAVRRLTQAPGSDADPTWAPLGDRLAYVHGPNMVALDVRVVDANGTDGRTLVCHRRHGALSRAWSPDGTRIAYTVESGSGSEISVVAADGPPAPGTRLASGREPDWAPLPAPAGRRTSAERHRVAAGGRRC